MDRQQRDRQEAMRAARQALAPPLLSISAMPGKQHKQNGPGLTDILALADWILRGDEALDDWNIG